MATGKQKFATLSTNNCLCDQLIHVGDEIWPIEGMIPPTPSRPARALWVHVGCARRHFAVGAGELLVPPPCPYFVKKGWCLQGDQCFYAHLPDPAADVAATADGGNANALPQPPGHANAKGRKRKNGRRKVANACKAGTFRRWLIETFGRELMGSGAGVLDVAGGSGELAFELVNLNSIPTAIVDPRPLQAKQLAPGSKGDEGSLVRRLKFGLFGKTNVLFQKYLGPGYESNRANPRTPRHLRLFFDAQLVDWAAELWPAAAAAASGDMAGEPNADDGNDGLGGAKMAAATGTGSSGDGGGGDGGDADPPARRHGHVRAGGSVTGSEGNGPAAADATWDGSPGAGAEDSDDGTPSGPSFIAAALSRALATRSYSIMHVRSRPRPLVGADGLPTATESTGTIVGGPLEIDTGVRGALGNQVIAITLDDEV